VLARPEGGAARAAADVDAAVAELPKQLQDALQDRVLCKGVRVHVLKRVLRSDLSLPVVPLEQVVAQVLEHIDGAARLLLQEGAARALEEQQRLLPPLRLGQ